VQDQHDFAIAIIPQVPYHGKGSTVLSNSHMGTNKIKLDYIGFIHVTGKQRFETVDRHLHVVPSSYEGWNLATLLHDYKHPSTWTENLYPITGNLYGEEL